jgi:hypothetical protein
MTDNQPVLYKRGCLWYGLVLGSILVIVFVLAITLALQSPDSFPANSTVVSKRNRTCIEVMQVQVSEGFPDWHYETHIYYTQLGGWFETRKQVLLNNPTNLWGNPCPVEYISCRRTGTGLSARIEVNMTVPPSSDFGPPVNATLCIINPNQAYPTFQKIAMPLPRN